MHNFAITDRLNPMHRYEIPHLILIKHAMPVIQPEIASTLWHLTKNGCQAAHNLAVDLISYNAKTVFSSKEPKASATAQGVATILDLPMEITSNLHEHVRGIADWKNSRDNYNNSLNSLFEYPDLLKFGCETGTDALNRFESAVINLLKKYRSQDIIIVSHGTVISLLVSHWTKIEPFPFWLRLQLPDMIVLAST